MGHQAVENYIMLFNSPEFIFVFLPVTLLGLFILARVASHSLVVGWLIAANLFFYGWWNPSYLLLLVTSILFNFSIGKFVRQRKTQDGLGSAKTWLVIGIIGDLGLLFYYKYFNFFVDTLDTVFFLPVSVGKVFLPLAISFFTFQQIAFLVDTYRGETPETNVWHYALFQGLFPHLIAGPIVRYQEVVPQFFNHRSLRFDASFIAHGLTLFLLGLFKKVCLADGFSPYVATVFTAASQGASINFLAAWGGALSYTLQLYFDFSGYSDMAVGLAKMMGIDFPMNFNSPYKATNIIDFWRRWHITLTRFLTQYLYIPLGGNKHGEVRRYINIVLTMLLAGLWHGANWTCVFWGGLHGLFMVMNHLWRRARRLLGLAWEKETLWGRCLGRALTFLCVVCAWVIFRADTFSATRKVLEGMSGMNEVILPQKVLYLVPFLVQFAHGSDSVPLLADGTATGFIEMATMILLGLGIVFWGKNLYEMTERQRTWLLVPTFAFTIQQVLFARHISEFLYFRF